MNHSVKASAAVALVHQQRSDRWSDGCSSLQAMHHAAVTQLQGTAAYNVLLSGTPKVARIWAVSLEGQLYYQSR